MKRLHLILLLAVMTLSSMSQTVGEAFYIYRNDGQFNAFFRDEVVSVDYSQEDAEGNHYDEIVTQIVNTVDSVYMIPLASIDSISFVQPETIYQEDAIPLEGTLFDYLISVDGMTLTFASNMPATLTPKVGDKIVTMELTDKLPYGFSGMAKLVTNSSSGIEVLCDSIELDEVVKQFYGIVIMGDDGTNNIRPRAPWRDPKYYDRDYELPNSPINIPIDVSGYITKKSIFDINGKAEINVSIVPHTAVRVTLVIDGIRSHTKVHLVSRLVTKTTIDICGEASKDLKLNLLPNDGNYRGPWNIPLYFAIGPKLELSGEIMAEFTIGATIDVVSDITYYPQTLIPLISTLSPIINRIDGKVNVSDFNVHFDRVGARGSLRAGAFFRGGVSTGDHKKAWMGIEADGGGKCDVDFLFDIARLREADRSTALYDELKSLCDLEVKPFFGVHFMASSNDDKYTFKTGPEFDDFGGTWFKGGLVPTFSDTKLTRSASGTLGADATTNITGACPIKYTVGYSLFDSQKNRVEEPQYFGEKYSVFNSFSSYPGSFDNLKSDETYKVYPTISLFGYPMLASPSAELEMNFPVKITNFKQTDSHYEKDAFTNNGLTYSYKYDCAVTVELTNRKGVEDWGYVYKDPYGQIARISLRSYGSPYTDTHYSYYRNESSSVITLYGYVKYVGDSKYYYGRPWNYQVMYKADDYESMNFEISIMENYANDIRFKCSFNKIGNHHFHPVIYVSANKENMDSNMIYVSSDDDFGFWLGSIITGSGRHGGLQPSTTYYIQPAIVDDIKQDIVRFQINELTTLPHYSVQKPELFGRGFYGDKGDVTLYFDIIDNCVISDDHDEFDVTYNVEQAGIYYNTSGNPGPGNAVFVAAPYLSEDCSRRYIGGRMTINYVYIDNLSTKQTYYFRGIYKKDGITYYGDVFSYDWSYF